MSLQQAVGEWGEETFPHSTPQSCAAHLEREVRELQYELANLGGRGDWQKARERAQEELADCYLLLLHLAHKLGLDLELAASVKHVINKGREWGEPDAEGVVEHVRPEAAAEGGE